MTKTNENIIEKEYPDALNENFMRYAKMVIIQRAIPDARDGLKPSQRRVLVAMEMLSSTPTGKYIKCARIAGDTSGKLHPHGEQVVYPTLVNLAQDFKTRYPLIDGQGNFGSPADKAAAARYTEARFSKVGASLVQDLNEDIVPHVANYNDEFMEPIVLPGMFPNLLANGATGIAVGITTKMPSHNLRELVALMRAYKDNPKITVDEMIKIMPGPDFPTGGVILGQSKIKEYYEHGKTINGGIVMEGVYTIEVNKKGTSTIVITQFPIGGSPEKMSEQVKELTDVKKPNHIEGIIDIQDFSAGSEVTELQIEIAKNANAQIILNKLLKSTCLRTSFDVHNTVLVGGKTVEDEVRVSENVPILKLIDIFLEHRQFVLTNKFTSEQAKATARVHILDGLIRVSQDIDKAIKIIRASDDVESAVTGLINSKLVDTVLQAQAVLSITLRQLTKLEANKLLEERLERLKRIEWLDAILNSSVKMKNFIINEQEAIAKAMGDDRRTKIGQATGKIVDEDLIPNEKLIISLTKDRYIKQVPLETYRVQLRGGKGVKGVGKREDDEASDIFIANAHDSILFFTNHGMAYRKRGYEIPEAARTSRGIHLNNLLALKTDIGEEVTNVIPLGSITQEGYLLMITKKGLIKKTEIKEYDTALKTKGLSAIKLVGDDLLAFVEVTDGQKDILIATSKGKAIRYNESEVRSTGRSTQGVRALSLKPGDTIAQLLTLETKLEPDIMVVTSRGYGKRSASSAYRARSGRGGSGVDTISKVSADRNGLIVGACAVTNDDTILILTAKGKIIQVPAENFRTTGRTTMGVKLAELDTQDTIVCVAKVHEGFLDQPDEEEAELAL